MYPMHSRKSVQRVLIKRTFDKVAEVFIPTQSIGSVGEPVNVWGNSSFSVEGNLQMVTGREFIFQLRPTLQADFIFFCEWTTPSLEEQYKLKIDDREFEIMFVDDKSFSQIYQELYLREYK